MDLATLKALKPTEYSEAADGYRNTSDMASATRQVRFVPGTDLPKGKEPNISSATNSIGSVPQLKYKYPVLLPFCHGFGRCLCPSIECPS